MTKEQFIEKYQPELITENGIEKDKRWLSDFYHVLLAENQDTLNYAFEVHTKALDKIFATKSLEK